MKKSILYIVSLFSFGQVEAMMTSVERPVEVTEAATTVVEAVVDTSSQGYFDWVTNTSTTLLSWLGLSDISAQAIKDSHVFEMIVAPILLLVQAHPYVALSCAVVASVLGLFSYQYFFKDMLMKGAVANSLTSAGVGFAGIAAAKAAYDMARGAGFSAFNSKLIALGVGLLAQAMAISGATWLTSEKVVKKKKSAIKQWFSDDEEEVKEGLNVEVKSKEVVSGVVFGGLATAVGVALYSYMFNGKQVAQV